MSLVVWGSSLVFLFFGVFLLFGLTWPKPTRIGKEVSRSASGASRSSRTLGPEDLLDSLAQGERGVPGMGYLESLVQLQSTSLGASSASIFVSLDGEPGEFRLVAHWQQFSDRWQNRRGSGEKRIHIKDKLRRELTSRRVMAMPAGGLFSAGSLLADGPGVEPLNGIEPDGLVGHLVTGIHDSQKQLIGCLAVADNRALDQDALTASAMRIYAAMAGAELERLALEGALGREAQQRKEIEEDLRASYRHLRDLAHHLQSDQEAERARIAAQIHDQLGQSLTAIKMDLVWLRGKISNQPPTVDSRIEAVVELADTTVKTVRRIATELRPQLLDELGLVAAIEWQARDYQERAGLKCRSSCRVDSKQIHPDLATAMFRSFQELLTNVVRHAEATRVDVSLREIDNSLVLTVTDDGKGFSTKELSSGKSFGLRQVQERANFWAGSLLIERCHPRGMAITVAIPFDSV